MLANSDVGLAIWAIPTISLAEAVAETALRAPRDATLMLAVQVPRPNDPMDCLQQTALQTPRDTMLMFAAWWLACSRNPRYLLQTR